MRDERFLAILSALPRTVTGDFDLDDVMGRLGDDIADALGAAGAGVMLEDERGDLRFVAASDDALSELERLQIELGEGPCLYAYRHGTVVVADSLPDDDRFPAFATKAVEVGIASVFSFPLEFQGDVIGALNLYDKVVRGLDDSEIDAGRMLADVATAYLVNARDAWKFQTQNSQLTHALKSRVEVEQAKGWIRGRTGVKETVAWEALRGHARSHQITVHEVARQVLDERLDATRLIVGQRR